jgi:hypothetical protein
MADENQTKFERVEDFASYYANNVQFEASAWDLKLIFGQLDQSQQPVVVEQHTAMTMPWSHAKIMAYFFIVNIIIHQGQHGMINIPSAVIPPRPNPLDPELDEVGRKTIGYLAWVHDQFFSPSPYLPPEVSAASPVPADAPVPAVPQVRL